MTMHSAVARLLAATGPDPRLDAEIEAAIFGGIPAYRCSDSTRRSYGPSAVFRRDDGSNIMEGDWHSAPSFTGSLDAARTLFPPWASFELTTSAAGPPYFSRCRIWDWRRSPTMSDPGNEWKSEGNRPIEINATIAALRARAGE